MIGVGGRARPVRRHGVLTQLVSLLVLAANPASAHWIQTHDYLTEQALRALRSEHASGPGARYARVLDTTGPDGRTFADALRAGVHDADLRANGIYALGTHCRDYTTPMPECPADQVVRNDVADWPVGDHMFDPSTGKGVFNRTPEAVREALAAVERSATSTDDGEREAYQRLLAALPGDDETAKLASLTRVLESSNALHMALEFSGRAASEWDAADPAKAEQAFYDLGFALHLLQDMTVPTHVRLLPEKDADYERYVWETTIPSMPGEARFKLDAPARTAEQWIRETAATTRAWPVEPAESARRSVELGVRASAGFISSFLDAVMPGTTDAVVYVHGGNLWVANLDGTGARQVTQEEPESDEGIVMNAFSNFDVSRDGRVVYDKVRRYGEEANLFYGSLSDGAVRQLTTSNDSFAPRFSPDGKTIAFAKLEKLDQMSTFNSQGAGVWVLDPATGEQRKVVGAPGPGQALAGSDFWNDSDLVWSHDGTALAFRRMFRPRDRSLILVAPMKPGPVRATYSSGPYRYPTPTDLRGGVVAIDTPERSLLLFDTERQKSQTLERSCCGAFSPDGDRLAFLRACSNDKGREPWIRDLRTGTEARVKTPPGMATCGIYSVAWLPPGKRLLVSSAGSQSAEGVPTSQVWTLGDDGSAPSRVTRGDAALPRFTTLPAPSRGASWAKAGATGSR